ncbi:MAG: hypothetical protein Q8Q59_06145 [Luteolibacter sp.]|jgi:hypothetical protein|nr:hypothetical protein [Luteolibacter sp.]
MKPRLFPACCVCLPLLAACDSKPAKETPSPSTKAARISDTPLLPVKAGDSWIYQVKLGIPAGVSSAGAAEVSTEHLRTRTYLGKISAAEGLPETDCFEVKVPGSPREREFVEIHDDRILMRGSLILRPETTRPMWLDRPVPFVIAGMRPGTSLPELKAGDGSLTRQTRVIARENITVPAGAFSCIRLLTTGNDGDLELRRTIWFAPGTGIVREEKTRYRREQLVFREIQELTGLKRTP